MPNHVLKIMSKGEDESIVSGWAALECEQEFMEIGDVYYSLKTKDDKQRLVYFEFESDSHTHLVKQSVDSDEWGDWENEILPNLKPLNVSCVSGLPRIIGWRDSSFCPHTFFVKGMTNPNSSDPISLEFAISGSSYFDMVSTNNISTYNKPKYNSVFKKIRKSGFSLLPSLSSWPISKYEMKEAENYNGVPKINWAKRLKLIANCSFIAPKYRELIYWITTKSL